MRKSKYLVNIILFGSENVIVKRWERNHESWPLLTITAAGSERHYANL